jgi:OsmC subfamily peroxiredoxin
MVCESGMKVVFTHDTHR